MLRQFFLYLFLAFLIGCGPSQTIKKEGIEEKPEKTESESKKHYNIGYEYLKMKMYSDAIINFEKAIEDSATYVDAYLALAKAYIETQQYGLAEETYKTMTEKVPGTLKGWIGLGSLYVKMARYDDAIEAYNKGMQIDSLDASVYHGLGHVYEKKKDHEKAREYLERAYNLEPENGAIAFALAKIYLKLERCNEASVLLAKIAKEFPKDIEVALSLGDAYYDCKKYSEALEQYKKVEPELPEFATINIKKANALEGLRRYSEAAEEYIKAVDKSENKRIPYIHLINMYLKIKNYGKAQKYITQAFAVAPNDPALNCMKGDVYLGYGDGARARKNKKAYETAIAHYKTAKGWYRKALGDAQWRKYAEGGIKRADIKIKNTQQEMWYGDD